MSDFIINNDDKHTPVQYTYTYKRQMRAFVRPFFMEYRIPRALAVQT